MSASLTAGALDEALRFFAYAQPVLGITRREEIHAAAVAELASLKAQADALAAALERSIAAHCQHDKLFCSTCNPARSALAAFRGRS